MVPPVFARAARTLPLLLLAAAPLAGQTADQARLVLGAAIGWTGGVKLWEVPDQTVLSQGILPDVFHLSRRIRPNVAALGHATLFRGNTFGYTAELSYIGVGVQDDCTHVTSSGDPVNAQACTRLKEFSRPASAVSLTAGVVARATTNGYLTPYVKALVGGAIMPRSTVLMSVAIGEESDSIISIYADEGHRSIKPVGTLAVGLMTIANPGYQFTLEARGNWMRVTEVTGASERQSLEPPNRPKWVMLPQVVAGFSIVLEKKRGRRY